MVVMLIVMVALGTIAGLTVVSVQGGSAQVGTQRFSAMALYAAESGAAVAMAYLPAHHQSGGFDVDLGVVVPQLAGNGAKPGESGNLLSDDQQGWYEVVLLNNAADASSTDSDSILVIQSTGHGPGGAMKRIQWEVAMDTSVPGGKLTLLGWRDVF